MKVGKLRIASHETTAKIQNQASDIMPAHIKGKVARRLDADYYYMCTQQCLMRMTERPRAYAAIKPQDVLEGVEVQ